MLWIFVLMGPAALLINLWRHYRKYRELLGDWTFLHNRRVLYVGAAIALLLIAPNLASLSSFAVAVPTSVVLGGLVAMTLNRYGPLAEESKRDV